MRLRKGDKVIVISGKDRGRKGTIEKIFRKRNKILVSGINMVKKHLKKTDKAEGGIIEFAKPLFTAKLTLICPECGKKTRVGYTFIDDEKKRICKKCGKLI